jgi:geranylgeranyl diphosphate synthase type I
MTVVLPVELADARELITPLLRSTIDTLDASTRKVCDYHFGWIDERGAPASPGGKALRPALTLLSAQAASAPREAAAAAGAALELVHNFSLLHDDVMDGDTERRHRPTAWTVFGVPAAILAGDAMLTLAMDVVRNNYSAQRARDVEACLAAAVRRLIAGQSADVDLEQRQDATLAEGLRMAADKTASLISCGSSLGALAAGAPAALVSALAGFGEHLGVAFQMIDDLLGIWGKPEITGKPAMSDLLSCKKTIPVLVAMESETPAGVEFRERYLSDPVTDPRPLAELVERAGGLDWTRDAAQHHVDAALRCLDEADIPSDTKENLKTTAHFVTERTL